ncbi:MAG: helix-turn-helix transcriptional regulator [Clostridia bacterium]|nr:helix-turn-helix transcriptional regulator [Clostridia bacterium]
MMKSPSSPFGIENDDYAVSFAERRDVGDEWNLVRWNKAHREIDCHRLYFRTDTDGGLARLHLIDGDIDLVAGRVYFIPAFSVLESEIDGTMNKYYIHFRSSSQSLSLYRFLSGNYSVEEGPLTQPLFDTVVENYTKNTHQAHMKVRGAMSLLLSDFFEKTEGSRRELERFGTVLSYIEKNYTSSISLSELASLMSISPLYFSNYFKATFRISPKQYILNKRLAEAQRLLLETDMTVKEIASTVGFENENYFSEFFSAKIGVSALKYRKRALPSERASIF